jgi:hypothetical protein
MAKQTPKTKPSQLKASKAYQERNARLVAYFPVETKKALESALKAHGLTPKAIFEMGLKQAGIPLEAPKSVTRSKVKPKA